MGLYFMLIAGGGACNDSTVGIFTFDAGDLPSNTYWIRGSALLQLIAGGCADNPLDLMGAFPFAVNTIPSYSGWDYGSASF